MNFKIDIPSYSYPGSWMIGARTFAADRIVCDVERIWQPSAKHDHGGTIEFRVNEAAAEPMRYYSRKKRLFRAIRPKKIVDAGLFFDARNDEFFNWSHHINFYLTLALAARDRIGEAVTMVVPPGMPNILFDMYRLFGFDVIATEGVVRGLQCKWSVPDWEIVPCGRQILAPGPFRFPKLDLPTKVFLSRRGTRSLTNEAEIEAALPGFTKIYAEDLSASEQFSLWQGVTDVVAIHGAAIAPMQYRRLGDPLRLTEISPIGHVSRWFGIMCHQVGGSYIQVRGRIKPEYVRHLYGAGPYTKHSGDTFEVDPESLRIALELIQGPL